MSRGGRLDGKVALVTGGGAGIGLATAEKLVDEGATVVVGDLARYEEAAEQLREFGGQALGLEMDVAAGASVREAVARAVERFGGLDVLVNNAGIGWPRLLPDITEEEWDRIMAVDLKGPFLCSQAALPHLQARGGAIVNVSSLAGRSSSPAQGCFYSAAKAGLLGLTRHLARELAPRVRVNAVCPGFIDTELVRGTVTPERVAEIVATVPLRRIGQARDIANVIAFLASDEASFLTGAAVDANGGIFMA